MTYRQAQLLKAFQQLKAAFDKHAATWNPNVRLSADISLFVLNLASIEIQAVIQEINTTGIGKTKKTLRADLIEQAMLAATAVLTFAKNTKDHILAAAVAYSTSQLKQSRESDLVAICQVILEKATTHAASLGDYGADTATLADLQTTLDKYRELAPQPQTAVLSGKTITQSLASLFRATAELVKESIDGKLLQYKKKGPDFYAAYTNARTVGRVSHKKKKEAAPVPVVAPETVF